MGDSDQSDEREAPFRSLEVAAKAHDHALTLQTLRRIALTLGRPIEDFFKSDSRDRPIERKPDIERD